MTISKNSLSLLSVVLLILLGGIWYAEQRQKPSGFEERLAACGSLPNESTQHVVETTRMFINVPKDLYPNVNLQMTSHGATASYISNGGPYGGAIGAQGKPNCWSYYFEFEGNGTVNLASKSGIGGVPDYTLYFVVSASTSTQSQDGTLEGTMTIGPVCPVEQIGHPCNPTPQMYAAHQVFVYDSSKTKLITTLTPDAQGTFSVSLPAGEYIVDVHHQGIGSVQGAPSTVHILTGQTKTITIHIDTGIR